MDFIFLFLVYSLKATARGFFLGIESLKSLVEGLGGSKGFGSPFLAIVRRRSFLCLVFSALDRSQSGRSLLIFLVNFGSCELDFLDRYEYRTHPSFVFCFGFSSPLLAIPNRICFLWSDEESFPPNSGKYLAMSS